MMKTDITKKAFIALMEDLIYTQFKDESSWTENEPGKTYSFVLSVPKQVDKDVYLSDYIKEYIDLILADHLPYYKYYEGDDLLLLEKNLTIVLFDNIDSGLYQMSIMYQVVQK